MMLVDVVRLLRDEPLTFLDVECVVALREFLRGLAAVDLGFREVIDEAARDVEGPSEADLCTKARILADNSTEACRMAVACLERSLVHAAPRSTLSGWLCDRDFVSMVRDPITTGRFGMVLTEPSVSALHHLWQGCVVGHELRSSSDGQRRRDDILAFERFVRKKCGARSGRWHHLIAVFHGPHESGLRGVLEEWDDFREATRADDAS